MKINRYEISVVTCAIDPMCTQYLVPFINSLNASSGGKRVEIIIRDNGLKPSTKTFLRKRFPQIKVVGNGINVNFAQGINEAFRHTHGPFLYIANVDSLVEKNLFTNLIDAFNSDSSIGVAAPVVYSLSQKKAISERDLPVLRYSSSTGRVIPLSTAQLDSLKSMVSVEWVSGCGMMIRRELWEKLNGFDETFKAYWEDADLCLRVKKHGFRVVVVHRARLWHESSIVYGKDTPEKIYRLVKSSLYFTSKHATILGIAAVCGYAVLLSFTKIIRIFFGSERENQKAYMHAVKDYFFHI